MIFENKFFDIYVNSVFEIYKEISFINVSSDGTVIYRIDFCGDFHW